MQSFLNHTLKYSPTYVAPASAQMISRNQENKQTDLSF